MLINIVNSDFLFNNKVWSVSFLIPHEEIVVNNRCSLMTLGDVITERKENSTANSEDGIINYIGLENIESCTGRVIDFETKRKSDIKSTCKKFYKGDILFGRLRPNLNKILYNDQIESGECSTEIHVLIPNLDIVNPVFLAELLRSAPINKRIISLVRGAALPRVSISDLKKMAIPIPPLEEQNRLAEIINYRRKELESHILIAKQIPKDLSDLVTEIYSE